MTVSWGSGEAYESLMGRWSQLIAPKFLKWARIPPAADVLDVGCGTGAGSEAILALGAKGLVGVDPSPAFVAYATSRLAGEGRNVRFQVGDAMQLRFTDDSFDAVVAGLVLNFISEPERAVREMRRVVKQQGVVAAYVWDYAGRMEMLRHFWDAAVSLDPAARSLDEGVRFTLCRPERLAELFEGGGLTEVEVTSIEQEMVFQDFDDYWRPFLGGQGPSGGYAMGLSEDKRERLRDEIRARLQRSADGRIRLVARAWAVRGIKPQS